MKPKVLTFALAVVPFVVGCSNSKATPAPASDAGLAGMAHDAGADASSGDDVEPVYAVDPNAPAAPLAEKLCSALTEMPERRRAECCAAPRGIVVTSECTRTLSAAIRDGAVAISEAAVDACIAAYAKTLEGCDWVGPFAPGPPAACQGIVTGQLRSGDRCRSSLECSGSLRCNGVGPTTRGRCGPAKGDGELCGVTTDTLATFVRQNDVDRQHPECASGRCIQHRCAPPVEEDGACQVSQDCADGLQCVPAPVASSRPPKASRAPRKCRRRDLPHAGEACPGGLCGDGLACVSGKCMDRKPTGEACTTDFECRGGCLKSDGDAKGTCGPRCDVR